MASQHTFHTDYVFPPENNFQRGLITRGSLEEPENFRNDFH